MYTVIHRRILGWPLYALDMTGDRLMLTTMHTFVWENIWDFVSMSITQR